MKKQFLYLFISLLFSILFSACSNGKEDYADVLKFQKATEQTLQQTSDYDIKIRGCDNVIRVLDNFLEKHPSGEWSDAAKIALQSWQSKRITLISERDSLINELSVNLLNKAADAARNQHELSNIEKIYLESSNEHTVGNIIFVTNVYNFRMRGAILGRSIFKLKVTASGYIATDSNKVVVNNKTIVVE